MANAMSMIDAIKYDPNISKGRIELIVEILDLYNLRISEVLNLKWSDVIDSKMIYVQASKHSHDTIIRDRQIVQQIIKLHRIDSTYIFKPVTYTQVYTYIKRYLSHRFSKQYDKKNKKITHYFRYKNAQSLKTKKQVSTMLNHSGQQSARYYNNKLQE